MGESCRVFVPGDGSVFIPVWNQLDIFSKLFLFAHGAGRGQRWHGFFRGT